MSRRYTKPDSLKHDVPIAIAVVAYNRPACLSSCLTALKKQTIAAPVPHLYLDGPRVEEDNVLISQCLRVFQEAYKDHDLTGHIHASPTNVGSDANFGRALTEAWRTCDQVMLLEDDIEFTPTYFEQIQVLLDFLKDDPDIASVSAWGLESREWTREEIERNKNLLVNMHNQCGSVLTKAAKRAMERHVLPLSTLPVNQRRQYLIDHFNLEIGSMGFGFDECLYRAMHRQNLLSVSTAFRLLRHIGSTGVNNDYASWQKLWSDAQLPVHHGWLEEAFVLDKDYVGLVCQLLMSRVPDYNSAFTVYKEAYRVVYKA